MSSESDDILSDFLAGNYRLSKEEIAPLSPAIANPDWQRYRLSMKGKSTDMKLVMLRRYLRQGVTGSEKELRYVRVQNYINALKRGGQLSVTGEIQR